MFFEIQKFSFNKLYLKISANWQLFLYLHLKMGIPMLKRQHLFILKWLPDHNSAILIRTKLWISHGSMSCANFCCEWMIHFSFQVKRWFTILWISCINTFWVTCGCHILIIPIRSQLMLVTSAVIVFRQSWHPRNKQNTNIFPEDQCRWGWSGLDEKGIPYSKS